MAFTDDFLKNMGGDVDILFLALDEIHVEEQIRKEFKDIDSLATSIKSLGLQNPLVVLRQDDGYLLNQGERRYRALSLLVEQGHTEFERVACRILESESDEIDFMRQFTENFSRSNLTPLEYADALVYYRDNFDSDRGWKTRFSERFGVSNSFVSRHLKFVDAPDSVKKLCADGIVTSISRLNDLSSIPDYQVAVDMLNDGKSYVDTISALNSLDGESLDSSNDTDLDESNSHDSVNKPESSNQSKSPILNKNQINSLIQFVMDEHDLDDVQSLIDFLNSK